MAVKLQFTEEIRIKYAENLEFGAVRFWLRVLSKVSSADSVFPAYIHGQYVITESVTYIKR